MWPYWLMFLAPAIGAVLESSDGAARRDRHFGAAWFSVWLLLVMMVGLRHNVGGDWFNYLPFLLRVRDVGLFEAITMGDPAYQFLNWLFADLETGIYFVNVCSGLIFATGLVIFCRSLPFPWLAMTVAVPYLVIVVAMGYSRQGVALALAMIGIVALRRGSMIRFVAWVAAAALFHKSALLLVPLGALASSENRYWAALWVSSGMGVLYYLMLSEEVENLYVNYVVAGYQSQGAMIRLVMNALPAVVFLLFRNRFAMERKERHLWMAFSALSLALLGLLFLTNASTAVDRVALYLLPLQLVVAAHAPTLLARGADRAPNRRAGRAPRVDRPSSDGQFIALGVLFYYAAVQFVWLNFATHAFAWLPYRFYPLDTGY